MVTSNQLDLMTRLLLHFDKETTLEPLHARMFLSTVPAHERTDTELEIRSSTGQSFGTEYIPFNGYVFIESFMDEFASCIQAFHANQAMYFDLAADDFVYYISRTMALYMSEYVHAYHAAELREEWMNDKQILRKQVFKCRNALTDLLEIIGYLSIKAFELGE